MNIKISLPWFLTVIALIVGGLSVFEVRALDKIDHPKVTHVSCTKCHTDSATLAAIAEKAADPLYLVHNGDLTLAQLKQLEGGFIHPLGWKPKRTKSFNYSYVHTY